MLTFWAIAALSGGHGPQWRQSAVKGRQAQASKTLIITERRTRVPRCWTVGYSGIVDAGGCMEIDRASTQRLVAKLGVTVGFLFLLAIIALAFT
jgi:hypothetical protein